MKKQKHAKPASAPRNLLELCGHTKPRTPISMALPAFSVENEFKLAAQHHVAGRLEEAERICKRILAFMPRHADALHVCGVVAAQTGRLDAAAEFMGKAIDANPMAALYYRNCANALKDAGKIDQAIDTLQRCLRMHPRDADAHFQLGTILGPARRTDEAIASFREAVRHRPNHAESWCKLGTALAKQKELDEAIAAFRRSIELQPLGATYSHLGAVLTVKGELDQAIEAYRIAVKMTPESPESWCNFGLTLQAQGIYEESMACYETAIRILPEREYSHWNLSQVLLMHGDFQRGWAEYEWRWKLSDFKSPPCNVPQPQWRGEDLAGKTILLHMEQGRGDVIQFIRYVPLLIERGAEVIVYCRNELIRLLRGVTGVTRLTVGAEMVTFDYFCPLLSLPLAMGTTVDTIPGNVPYLFPEPGLVQAWGSRLSGDAGDFRVGLVWAGSTTHANDKNRSITLAQYAPLARAPGVTFYSLQKGDGTAAQAAAPPAGMELHDHTAGLTDFTETAALISHLDLVITVDTAVAHLAGAMGKPVWVMIPYVPDWRWLLHRDDSPWYPTMRLFRQKTMGDWTDVIARVAEALQAAAMSRENVPALLAA